MPELIVTWQTGTLDTRRHVYSLFSFSFLNAGIGETNTRRLEGDEYDDVLCDRVDNRKEIKNT